MNNCFFKFINVKHTILLAVIYNLGLHEMPIQYVSLQ